MSEHTLHHLTWISVVRVKSSVSTKCLTIFLWVVGYATSHRWPQYVTEIYHPPSGTTAWVPVILTCRTPLVRQSMWHPVWTRLMISRIHTITLNIITLIFNSTNREQTFGCPVHTYNILDSCPGLGMSVVHCLPVQNRQNQSSTSVSETHVAP